MFNDHESVGSKTSDVKPLVFLSHSGNESPLARWLSQLIRRELGGRVEVFNTSEPEYRWRESVDDDDPVTQSRRRSALSQYLIENMKRASVYLLLISKDSLQNISGWIRQEIEIIQLMCVEVDYPCYFVSSTEPEALQEFMPSLNIRREFIGFDITTMNGLANLIVAVARAVGMLEGQAPLSPPPLSVFEQD